MEYPLVQKAHQFAQVMSCGACFFEAGPALGYDGDEILASVSDAGGTIFIQGALFGSVLTFVFTFCPGHRREKEPICT
jgi:hypothetical protein